jgi:hypothetical protein
MYINVYVNYYVNYHNQREHLKFSFEESTKKTGLFTLPSTHKEDVESGEKYGVYLSVDDYDIVKVEMLDILYNKFEKLLKSKGIEEDPYPDFQKHYWLSWDNIWDEYLAYNENKDYNENEGCDNNSLLEAKINLPIVHLKFLSESDIITLSENERLDKVWELIYKDLFKGKKNTPIYKDFHDGEIPPRPDIHYNGDPIWIEAREKFFDTAYGK